MAEGRRPLGCFGSFVCFCLFVCLFVCLFFILFPTVDPFRGLSSPRPSSFRPARGNGPSWGLVGFWVRSRTSTPSRRRWRSWGMRCPWRPRDGSPIGPRAQGPKGGVAYDSLRKGKEPYEFSRNPSNKNQGNAMGALPTPFRHFITRWRGQIIGTQGTGP